MYMNLYICTNTGLHTDLYNNLKKITIVGDKQKLGQTA